MTRRKCDVRRVAAFFFVIFMVSVLSTSRAAEFSCPELAVHFEDFGLGFKVHFVIPPHYGPDDNVDRYITWRWQSFTLIDAASTGLENNTNIDLGNATVTSTQFDTDLYQQINQNLTDIVINSRSILNPISTSRIANNDNDVVEAGFTTFNYLMYNTTTLNFGEISSNHSLEMRAQANNMMFSVNLPTWPFTKPGQGANMVAELVGYNLGVLNADNFVTSNDSNFLEEIIIPGPPGIQWQLSFPKLFLGDDVAMQLQYSFAIGVGDNATVLLSFGVPTYRQSFTMFAGVGSGVLLGSGDPVQPGASSGGSSGDGDGDHDKIVTIAVAVVVPVAALTVLLVITIAIVVAVIVTISARHAAIHNEDSINF